MVAYTITAGRRRGPALTLSSKRWINAERMRRSRKEFVLRDLSELPYGKKIRPDKSDDSASPSKFDTNLVLYTLILPSFSIFTRKRVAIKESGYIWFRPQLVSIGERERALLPFTQRVQEWQSTYWCAAVLNRPDRPNPVVLTKNRSTISYLMNMNLLSNLLLPSCSLLELPALRWLVW